LLEIKNLSVSFDSNKILDNLSMNFSNGSIIGIIGKNGSGKSTLLKAIEGLVKYEGEVKLDGSSLNNVSVKEKAKLISYLPQNRVIPQITARLMIEHGRFPYLPFSKTLNDNDKKIIKDAIDKTKVNDLLSKKLTEMSGGELQKIYITSTIVQQTKVVLLDEPTNHLDLESQIEILSMLKDLAKDGTTIIIVMHDLLQAFTYCDELISLNDHSIVERGKPEEIVNSKHIESIFKYNLISLITLVNFKRKWFKFTNK